MMKWILLAVLAGLAWWYFDYSHRMTEAQIRESYAQQTEAIRQFDADALCKRMSDDFKGHQTTQRGSDHVDEQLDKKAVCDGLNKSIALMKRMSDASRGLITLDVETEIKSIELSPNRKQATVQTVSTVRLGDMTLARDRTTEHLIRRNEHILSTGGDSKIWAYAPQ
jgi:hypothetical protein